jgi:hypothetical protein
VKFIRILDRMFARENIKHFFIILKFKTLAEVHIYLFSEFYTRTKNVADQKLYNVFQIRNCIN